MRFAGVFCACLLVMHLARSGSAAEPRENAPSTDEPAALEFFEKEVRPLLATRCQTCHGPAKQKGELRLDTREAILTGGSTGPAIVPGNPKESLLIDAINYGELYQMPPKSKLPAGEIATLTRWVEQEAPWPRQVPPKSAKLATAFDLKERAKHWCFQPLQKSALPAVKGDDWPRTLIDRYLLAALEARGLHPAPQADKRTLIRRLTFDLIGLPPTPAEVEAFVDDGSPSAYERLVDRLLASPHYGERWGRHWLDLVRFAETAGHEFDYDVPDAFRYRDYVIRAFNADVPYNQFVIEHVAGDLLESPRRHPTERFNESVLGTGFFFLGEGTHSPVDLLEDEAARVDNQIDVLSKTFLGLTVGCARCHDHKFDPITTKDYYALYGYLRSSRHEHAFLDPPERIGAKAAELRDLKALLSSAVTAPPSASPSPRNTDASIVFEDFEGSTYADWSATGEAFGTGPTRPGDFVVRVGGGPPVAQPVTPGQAHSGLLSNRLQGVLRSRTFPIEKRFIHYLAAGLNGRVNLVIDGFEKIRDPIYGRLTFTVSGDRLRWYTQDLAMWVGHRAYIELCDGAALDYTAGSTRYEEGTGYIAVDEIRFSDKGRPSGVLPIPNALVDLSRITAPSLASALARYRKIEAGIPSPTLGLAITEGTGEDERVHIRGGTRTLGEAVPRRFLEVLAGDSQPTANACSGRIELAMRMVEPAKPLLARVLVNRVWAHHFGQGIVATPDDFGVMGQRPTNPELLDSLAADFMAQGWSIKALHRQIVLSRAYRMSSRRSAESERSDPANLLLHRMRVRRLEAEAIRDALLAVSGRLDATMYGPSVPTYLSPFMEGRGRPGRSGPIDGDGRRSLYLNVRRNFLNPMLLAFDFPSPCSTMGRRNVSNVPAQALTLLNDPFVIGQARLWAEHVTEAERRLPRCALLSALYVTAYGRAPTDDEVESDSRFLDEQAAAYGKPGDPRAWADLCHVLINVKDFIYID